TKPVTAFKLFSPLLLYPPNKRVLLTLLGPEHPFVQGLRWDNLDRISKRIRVHSDCHV
ncbi:8832_t:CDS:2, partial [Paraglomus occultum]